MRKKQLKAEVTNWVVWVCYILAEKLADKTVGYVVPLYGTIKAFVLVMVLLWRGAGSQLIFDKLLKPLVRPYERPLDLAGFVANEILDISLAALLFVPRWAARRWKSRREADVPAILRGLRQPHQPRLAQSLADSIERAHGEMEKVTEPQMRAAAGDSTSLYPSLASLSPLPSVVPAPQPEKPAPAPSQSSREPAAAKAAAAEKRVATSAKGKGKARARDDSTDTDRETVKPAAKRTRTRASRAAVIRPDPQPDVSEVEMEEAETQEPRSPAPPPAGPAIPPTPAPPGAFAFASPHKAPVSKAAEAEEMQLDDSSDGETAPVLKKKKAAAPAPRRSARQSLSAAIAAFDEAEAAAAQQEVEHSTPREKPSRASKAAAKEKTATPRQKALGAIAQLSKDLLDDSDEGAGLSLSPKKRKAGVLARSTNGKSNSFEPAVKTRRARRTTIAEDSDEDYEEEAVKPGPKKRKARSTPAAAADEEQPARRSASTTRAKLATSTATAAKPAARGRASRTTRTSAAEPPSALPGSRSRLAASSSVASSRVTSPARVDEDGALLRPARPTATSTTAGSNGKAPPRKARRVLLGRGGATAPDEEEEVEAHHASLPPHQPSLPHSCHHHPLHEAEDSFNPFSRRAPLTGNGRSHRQNRIAGLRAARSNPHTSSSASHDAGSQLTAMGARKNSVPLTVRIKRALHIKPRSTGRAGAKRRGLFAGRTKTARV
ncbi:hypothetical protein JCM10213v2_001226 [Rhodosporidiobolus nylandii]